jgi:long-chain acyl-CoA synthetase
MIVTAGKNLYPEEIEQVLQAHPGIANVAVMAAPDTLRGARIVAVIRPAPGVCPSAAALIGFARQALPLYKTPRRYFIAATWPRTRSDKTDYATLLTQLVDGELEPLR